MKKTTLYIIITVVILLIAAGVGVYFYTQRRKKSPEATKKAITDIDTVQVPTSKPYDSQFKSIAEQFFNESGLTVEQQAALLEDMQKRFLGKDGAGKVDAFISAVANWMPAWEQDENLKDSKEKIVTAWGNLYKKWSELKAKYLLS